MPYFWQPAPKEEPPSQITTGAKIAIACLVALVILIIILVVYFNRTSQKDDGKLNSAGPKDQAVLELFRKEYHGETECTNSVFSSKGTYYGNVKEGACSYGTNLPPAATDPKISALAALNAPQFMGSLVCGMCFRVFGTGKGLGTDPIKGEYIVFTKDLCPPCKEGDVDLALDGDGRWDISIHAVQCPVGNTKIQYSYSGSNQWFVKLQIRNARIPITSVELQKNGVWLKAYHNVDGHWLVNSGSGAWQTGSIDIRMTAANGHELNDTIPPIPLL